MTLETGEVLRAATSLQGGAIITRTKATPACQAARGPFAAYGPGVMTDAIEMVLLQYTEYAQGLPVNWNPRPQPLVTGRGTQPYQPPTT